MIIWDLRQFAAHLVFFVLFFLAAPHSRGADSFQAIFEKAAADLRAGRFAEAESGFLRVLKGSPGHLGSLGNLGVIYSRTNRFSEAVAMYQRALQASPGEPGLLLNLGLAYLRQDNPAAAKPHFAALAQRQPGNAQAVELLATCRLLTGETAQAVTDLERLPPSSGVLYFLSVGYFKQGDKAKAEATLDRMLRETATPALGNFLMGKAYYDATLFEQSLAHFRKAAEQDPKMAGVQLELGRVSVALRQNDEAEQHLRRALQADAGSAETVYLLGALLVLTGREAEGVPLLEKARAARADGWGAWYYLGRARLQQGQAAQSIPLLERAAKLNPNESAVHYQLSRAYKAAGRDSEARAAAKRVAELKRAGLSTDPESLVLR